MTRPLLLFIATLIRARGSVVVKALCYKPEGRGFETRRDESIFFSIYLILPAALGPGVHSTRSRKIIFLWSKVWPVGKAAICEPIV
jgi:hypothetical protein